MKVGIMQPYFFPYLGYWQLINAVDRYVIYDDVSFIKGGWINRNNILMNGKPHRINIQLQGASPNKLINEISVSGDARTYLKFRKTIEQCYKKAPFYESVIPLVREIMEQQENGLARFLEFSIRRICDYLSIDTEILVSSDIDKSDELRGQDKVIEICRILGASEYVNAIGGQELYKNADFSANGIGLKFLRTDEVEYSQFDHEFVPKLSIIDVMMFNSKSTLTDMLFSFKLV